MALITRTLLRTARTSGVRSAMRPGRLFNTSAAVASPEQPASADSVTVSQSDFDNLKLSYKKLTSIKRSLSRNELSATFAAEVEDEDFEEKSLGDVIPSRFVSMFEVAVSKIFPAGCGWQGASVIADGWGYQATELPFFLITGAGDGLAVCAGHTTYMALKAAAGGDVKVSNEFHTGILLGTAAFFSGTAWQPLVNALHDGLGLTFNQCLLGTTIGCGAAFYTGLRVSRLLYSSVLEGVEEANYANLKADAALSLAIGGATAAFVGTDCSFMAGGVEENWLRPIVGIEDSFGDLQGVATAGASTALGFTAFQTVQNVVVTPGKNWLD